MKKKRKGKITIITLIILIVICLTCGVTGLVASKNDKNDNKPNKNKDYKVTYRYYIDGNEVEEMVKKEVLETPNTGFEGATNELLNYNFEKYTCTNNVTGEWDEEAWEFKPVLTANTTCRLYFLKSMHEVTVRASNGVLPNNGGESKVNVILNKDETINILPTNGYKYDTVTCNNDVIAEYNETTHDLKLSNVKKDSMCTISFKISDYTAEVNVSNGTVTENKKSSNYGGTVVFDVTPSENYRFDKVTCTNNQTAKYENEKLTITGLTNDTVCSVEFKPVKYQVSLEVVNGTLLASSTSPQSVAENRNVSFGISPNTGYQLTGAEASCNNLNGAKIEVASGTVFIYNVTSDLKCKVVLKPSTGTSGSN